MPSETSELDRKHNGNAHDEDSKARTRVSRACTRCRARKDRCDGQRPTCTACRNAQASCNYEPATKKRGLPEGYVRGLEKLLALLIGKIDGLEDTTSALMQEHHPDLLKIWNHSTVGEELHTTWKESKILNELENLLSGLDQHSSVGQKRKRDREDDVSNADEEVDLAFHVRSFCAISRTIEGPRLTTNLLRNKDRPLVEDELPPNAIRMVDHYFAHTHCWFPIVDRPQVLRACYELSRGKTQRENHGPTRSLLWAILAYTSKQYPHADHSGLTIDLDAGFGMHDTYYANAKALIPSDGQELTRYHAQSCLILALLDIGLGRWRSAWSLVGQAVRIVLFDASESRSSSAGSESAVFQGCAILDIAIASHIGVIPHLRRSDFQTRAMMNEDGYEEWEPWTAPGMDQNRNREPSFATSCFNLLTAVFLISSDLLSLLPQPEKLDRNLVQSLLAKLHHLQTTVPCPMPPSLQSPPHQIYLQLCHVSVQMRLVDLPIETGVGSSEKAKLACNVLGLLELCKNANMVGLEHVPPFVIDCVDSACKLARSSSSAFGPASGLPSYHEFNRTASELINSMAEIWPVYASIGSHHRSNSQTLSHGETSSIRTGLVVSPRPVSSPSIGDFPPQRINREGFGTPLRQGSGSFPRPVDTFPRDMSLPDLNNWQYPTGSRSGSAVAALPGMPAMQYAVAHMSSPAVDQTLSHMPNPIGLDIAGVSPAGAMGLTMPEPSPSFQGDEIDAIFHEMAHLDTNEWSTERALGLKDFGFSDDLTFQAFCNDPERLIAPGDGIQQPLSSNSQTWTFASPSTGLNR